MDLKTIGVAVGLSVTLATSVGTYFVLQYRVGALEVGLADLTVCPGGGR